MAAHTPNGISDNDDRSAKPFVEHLDDLRATIVKVLIVIIIATGICFYTAPYLLSVLKHPLIVMLESYYASYDVHDTLLRSLHPTGAFMMAVKMAFSAGIIITLPLTIYFIAAFILPGLTEPERRSLIRTCIAGGGLFVAGVVFCYYIALPLTLRFLWSTAGWLGISNDWTLENYITFTTRFLLLFGLTFETPAVILLLVSLGILSYHSLQEKRRYVIVAVFVIAAVITPPDVLTQVVLAVPLLILYEFSVWGAYFIHKKQRAGHHLAG